MNRLLRRITARRGCKEHSPQDDAPRVQVGAAAQVPQHRPQVAQPFAERRPAEHPVAGIHYGLQRKNNAERRAPGIWELKTRSEIEMPAGKWLRSFLRHGLRRKQHT